jgi:hypothetical protein
MEEPGKVIDKQAKNRKTVAGRETPVNLNKTNGDCLIRKLFNTPESKEILIQAPLKVNLHAHIHTQNSLRLLFIRDILNHYTS